jgi:hypothetical protein
MQSAIAQQIAPLRCTVGVTARLALSVIACGISPRPVIAQRRRSSSSFRPLSDNFALPRRCDLNFHLLPRPLQQRFDAGGCARIFETLCGLLPAFSLSLVAPGDEGLV